MSAQVPAKSSVRLLNTITEIFPFLWTNAYQRGNLFKSSAVSTPPTVTVHVTDSCPLKCPFCFASGMKSGPVLTYEELAGFFDEFRGLGRMILLGGEPFCRPDFERLLKEKSGAVDEVEIFTNGTIFLQYLKNIEHFTARFFPEERLSHFTLTLPLDPFHKERIGNKDYQKIITAALELSSKYPIRVKFNVTDSAFQSADYLNYNAVRELIGGYHPGLRELYDSLIRPARVEEFFYFNPVIQHAQTSEHGEVLKASELIDSTEIVIGKHRINNRVVMFRHLTALWMEHVPDILVLGYTDRKDIFSILLDNFVGRILDFDAFPYLEPVVRWLCTEEEPDRQQALRATGQRRDNFLTEALCHSLKSADRGKTCSILAVYVPWRKFLCWHKSRDAYYGGISEKLSSLTDSPTRFPVMLTDDMVKNPIPWQALRKFLTGYFDGNPERLAQTMRFLAHEIVSRAASGWFPTQNGSRLYLGVFSPEAQKIVPLESACLLLPGESAVVGAPVFPVVPNITFSKENGLQISFHFIKYQRASGMMLKSAYFYYLRMVRELLFENEWSAFREALDRESPQGLEIKDIAADIEPPAPHNPADSDAVNIFNMLFYDKRSDQVPRNHFILSEAIRRTEFIGFSRDSLIRLKEETSCRDEVEKSYPTEPLE